MNTPSRKVLCPQCAEETEYSTNNPYRPFCSKRCQLIDLGEWAEGTYRLPDHTPISQPELPDY